jgi:mono/diheme cytochrome c family protein
MVHWKFRMGFLLAGMFGVVTLGAQDRTAQDRGNDLPDGKGREIVAGNCATCHSLERITTSHRTREEWKDVIDRMALNGAALKSDEAGAVVEYLAKNFGPGNTPARAPESSGPAAAQQSVFKPVAGVYQLMQKIVAPNADVVWHVAMTPPKDDKEWTAVQNSALTLAEAGNLLMIGSRSKDQGKWIKAAQALIDSATVVFHAAEAKKTDELNEAGDRLVRVCAGCHRQYKPPAR